MVTLCCIDQGWFRKKLAGVKYTGEMRLFAPLPCNMNRIKQFFLKSHVNYIKPRKTYRKIVQILNTKGVFLVTKPIQAEINSISFSRNIDLLELYVPPKGKEHKYPADPARCTSKLSTDRWIVNAFALVWRIVPGVATLLDYPVTSVGRSSNKAIFRS
jgi:hypothetical protein